MSHTRYRAVTTSCGLAGILLIGLLLGMSDLVHSESEPTSMESAENVSLPEVSLQSSGPVTVYLPLIFKSYPPPPTVFGVQMHAINNSQGLTRAIEAKVYWVRFAVFHWDKIEPTNTDPSNYYWEVVDENSLRNAASNRMRVIATVQYTPSWAQKYSGSYCGPIAQGAFGEFAQFLTALVNRYKDPPYNVKYWELGNEPDAPVWYNRSGFGCWGEVGDPYYGGRHYGEMLKYAYPAIVAADPEAQVLIGGLLLDRPSGGTDNSPRFLEGILEAGGGPYFDVLSFHAYTYYGGSQGQMGNGNWPGSVTAVPEKVAFLREVLGRYGYGDKALMNTEAALLCINETTDCLETQTMYVPRAYAEALALGLQGQVYYAMINEGWRHTGLLQSDLTPKPVYNAYKAATSFLSYVTYEGPATGYSPGIAGHTFRKNDNTGYVDVLWSVDVLWRTVTLPAGASLYNRYGALVATSGSVLVNYSPVYVARP